MTESERLPQGWVETTLGEVTSRLVDGSHNPPKATETGKPMLSARNIQQRRIIFDDFRLIPEAAFETEHKRTQIAPSDVLLTIVGAIGRTAVVPESIEPFTLQRSVAVLKPLEIAPQLLSYFLEAPELQNFFEDNAKGTAQKGIYLKALAETPLPLPPLAEQIRIADKLDALLSRVEAGRERLERVPKLIKAFRQSVLSAAVSGELTREWRGGGDAEWGETTIETACEKIVDCPHSTPKWTESGKLCVRTSDFKPNKLNLNTARFVSEETFIERTSRLTPQSGDVLYSREGAILGIACMIPEGIELCLGQRMMLMRTSQAYSPKLLMFALNCSPILNMVQEATGGSASPHINVGDVKKFPLPLPPPTEQAEIVRRVESLFAIADRLEQRYADALKSFNSLTPALLAKAFRGELVPQDPADEPASVLLGRIRAARASAVSTKRKKTKAAAQATSEADAIAKLEARKLAQTHGTRQVGLWED